MFWARLALLCFTLIFMAAFGEVALRLILGPPVLWRYPQEHYVDDAELGYRLAPDQHSFTHDEIFETNSAGIRAPEVPFERPEGTVRILALGDSQTAGDGLSLEETWPAQLQVELGRSDPTRRFEVLNAGLSGSSPWHFTRLLRRLDERYELDGVAVALYVNDVVVDQDEPEPLVVTNTDSHKIAYALKRSALFTAIWRMRGPLKELWSPTPGAGRESRILSGEPDPVVDASWEDVERNLIEMRDYARERNLGLWFVVLPRRDQVDGSMAGRAYNERFADLAERLDLSLIDVLEPLRLAYEAHGRSLFIPWDGHNTARANAVVARELAPVVLVEADAEAAEISHDAEAGGPSTHGLESSERR